MEHLLKLVDINQQNCHILYDAIFKNPIMAFLKCHTTKQIHNFMWVFKNYAIEIAYSIQLKKNRLIDNIFYYLLSERLVF